MRVRQRRFYTDAVVVLCLLGTGYEHIFIVPPRVIRNNSYIHQSIMTFYTLHCRVSNQSLSIKVLYT